jgi:hypothetical protein
LEIYVLNLHSYFFPIFSSGTVHLKVTTIRFPRAVMTVDQWLTSDTCKEPKRSGCLPPLAWGREMGPVSKTLCFPVSRTLFFPVFRTLDKAQSSEIQRFSVTMLAKSTNTNSLYIAVLWLSTLNLRLFTYIYTSLRVGMSEFHSLVLYTSVTIKLQFL